MATKRTPPKFTIIDPVQAIADAASKSRESIITMRKLQELCKMQDDYEPDEAWNSACGAENKKQIENIISQLQLQINILKSFLK